MKSLAGKFIVFDGPDGCGKTTQRDLLAEHLESQGLSVVTCKDPGGTEVGDRIRPVLLDYDLSEMDVRCETLLFMASRAQLVGEIVEPALAQGKVVLCDRFVSATCAYQGAAGYDIKWIIDLAPFAVFKTWPDLTVVLDIDIDTGFKRTGRKPQHAGRNRRRSSGQHSMFDDARTDAMEARPLEFHRKVRQIFLDLQNTPPHQSRHNYPGPVTVVKTTDSDSPQQTQQEVARLIDAHFSV